jgi:hypothetical protein
LICPRLLRPEDKKYPFPHSRGFRLGKSVNPPFKLFLKLYFSVLNPSISMGWNNTFRELKALENSGLSLQKKLASLYLIKSK